MKALKFECRVFFSYTAVALISALSYFVLEVSIRFYVNQYFNAFDLGIWQSIFRMSTVYIGFFGIILNYIYMPKVALANSRKKILKLMLYTFLVTTLVLLFFLIFYNLLAEWIFKLAFSSEFIVAARYLLYQLVGDYFRIISMVIGFYFLAQRKFLITALAEISQVLINIFVYNLQFTVFERREYENIFICYSLSFFCYFMILMFFLFFVLGRSNDNYSK